MAQQTHPVDAYTAARNGYNGFLGWAHYRQTNLGLHVDSDNETVDIWSADDTDLHTTIEATDTCNQFLDDLDAALEEAA